MTARKPPLRINFWMTVCVVPVLGLLIGLGVWQLNRLQWKEGLIAERAAKLAMAPIPLSEVPTRGWEKFELRRITTRGRFLYDKTMNVQARMYKGRAGVHVITPLVLANGSGIVLVDRGWAPPVNRRHPGEFRRPQGTVEIRGILHVAHRTNPWAPDNDPAKGVWFFVDGPAMSAAKGLSNVRPYVVEAAPTPGDDRYPIGGQTVTKLRNEHLQYALTWFGLAITLVVMYVAYHLKERNEAAGSGDDTSA